MTPLVHGRAGTYVDRKCRCGECRAAWRVYTAQLREARAQAGRDNPGLIPHGATGYVNWACRCEVCKAGHAARHRERRAKAKAAKQNDLTP